MSATAEYFQSDRVSPEFEASLDAAEAQGFNDGFQGQKCQPRQHGFYGVALTCYQIGWKRAKSLRP